ncbi:hypothetical protein Tco_0992826 [Tanacetum coccineum]|uniref:Uncharacterized protein n=1 Tax=Tanacetum coccineum TaxID=301880 RepID=A0ABQ5F4P8_9ASTR
MGATLSEPQGLPSPEQTATAEVVPKSVAGSSFLAASSTLYVVPTGRVVVPTGKYIVPTGKVIIIVSTCRLSLVPTGSILSPGSKDLSRVGYNNSWKHDRASVVSKVIPHVAQKLVHSDEMGVLVAKLIKAAIFRGRCEAFEEVAKLEEPFDLSKNDNIK